MEMWFCVDKKISMTRILHLHGLPFSFTFLHILFLHLFAFLKSFNARHHFTTPFNALHLRVQRRHSWKMKAAHIVLLLAALTGATTCLLLRKHIFVSTSLSWTDAQAYCRNNYVDLSTIDSQEELGRFKNDAADHLSNRSWIGLSKMPSQKKFGQWSDGSAFGFTVWKSGQPDFPDTQHCVSISNAEFSDFYCTDGLPFICYTWEPTLIMVQKTMTWYEALVHCRTQYTDLVSLSTDTDFLQVNKIIRNFRNASVWTGLNFLDGSWFWVNNEPLRDPVLLPLCPIRPFRCGASVGVNILENRDCMQKMGSICYQRQGYVCQLLILVECWYSWMSESKSNNLKY